MRNQVRRLTMKLYKEDTKEDDQIQEIEGNEVVPMEDMEAISEKEADQDNSLEDTEMEVGKERIPEEEKRVKVERGNLSMIRTGKMEIEIIVIRDMKVHISVKRKLQKCIMKLMRPMKKKFLWAS